MTDSCDDLVRFLNGLSDGDFNEQVASRLSKLLTFCWESFDGSSETSMAAHKIDGRARGFKWKSPILTFEIERHGGTVIGSTRADRQEWTIDVEKRTARPAMIGYRQLTPRASAFKTEPAVSPNVHRQRRDLFEFVILVDIHHWVGTEPESGEDPVQKTWHRTKIASTGPAPVKG
jgi:hypothetical protein